ncbi:uncharacterized protein LOC141720009 [Apium graveolens]|uniref:uncharacterized protein LOC141720009 n=1 Tax=Apium graveolens TaxID=4045 RepID=UPI003D7B6179
MCLGAERVKQAKVQTLKAEFESLNMKDTEMIDDFALKLNALVTNIRALGETIEESYVVKKLLRSMPSKFLHITSSIEQFGNLDEMSVGETIGSLKAHEERVHGQTENTGGQLMLTEEEWVKRENTEGKLLFTREEWMRRSKRTGTETSPGTRTRVNSSYQECRRPRRDRDQKPEVNLTQIQDDEPVLLIAEKEVVLRLRNNESENFETNIWYLDNGASNHMTGDRSKFKELDT